MASSSFFTSNPAPVETRDVDSLLSEAKLVAQGIIDSANDASDFAQLAEQSSTNAANSAQAASDGASDALGSKNAAAGSASAAATSASNASGSATQAATSASQASTSASNAAQSATDANTYKQAALTAATNAGTSQAAAAQSETNAATSASQAAASVGGTVKYNQAQTLSTGEKTQARSNLGLATVAATGAYADLSGKPALATVATSGAYGDLSGKPSLGDAAAKNTGTTAGTLAAGDDSRITGALQALPVGTVVDRAYAEYTASADLTTIIPIDDTIPQVTEGVQVLSVSITPKSTTNRLRVSFKAVGTCNTAISFVTAALFQNGGANAIRAATVTVPTANYLYPLSFDIELVPGATTTQTFTVRVGPGAASQIVRLNGNTTGRFLGGVMAATLVVEEIKV